jgi:hypothetical protein
MQQIEYSQTRLVSRHHGTLPVLLTCPHDGGQVPRGVPRGRNRHPVARLPSSTATCAPAPSRRASHSACSSSPARRPRS